jgi:hydrogenase maturation protease
MTARAAIPSGAFPSILVAGVGNVFFGDDGFGCEVARRMASIGERPGVEITDFGIRGLDLAFAMLDGYDAVVVVDAVARGHEPGTLSVIAPDAPSRSESALDTHSMHPARVLALIDALGGTRSIIRIVGCEPERLVDADDEPHMGLSDAVKGSVEPAILLVERLIDELTTHRPNSEASHA